MALPIQIILIRQLAGYLGMPLFLVDPKGDLLFYNEPAEAILGRRFEETGAMPASGLVDDLHAGRRAGTAHPARRSCR